MAKVFTTQTPTNPNALDGAPGLVTATTEYFSAAGVVSGVSFYASTTLAASDYTVGYWQITNPDGSGAGAGTLLATKTIPAGDVTAGAWNDVLFEPGDIVGDALATSITVATNTLYKAGVHNTEGRFVVTLDMPQFLVGQAGITNAGITAPANGAEPFADGRVVWQGTYKSSGTLTYPNETFRDSCYFVAGIYTADTGGSTVSPDGVNVPVTLGSPSAEFVALAAPDGLAVPVSVGEPLASFATADAQPDGVSVPIAIGTPTIRHYVRPDGVSVTVAIGEPTVTAPPGPEPETPSSSAGWGGLLGVINSARADAALHAERRRHPLDCPVHGWPLRPNARGVLHCQFGGHIVRGR